VNHPLPAGTVNIDEAYKVVSARRIIHAPPAQFESELQYSSDGI
jgi:hypothetical protein